MRKSTYVVGLSGLTLAALAVTFQPSTIQASPPTETPIKILHPEIAPMPLRAYAYVATDLVYGTVTEIEQAHLDAIGDYTSVEISVASSLKQELSSPIHVALAACDTCSPRVVVPGSPTFQIGEQVVLFIEGDPNALPVYGILGLEQGTYRVQSDIGGGEHVYGLHATGEDVATFFSIVNQAWADGL